MKSLIEAIRQLDPPEKQFAIGVLRHIITGKPVPHEVASGHPVACVCKWMVWNNLAEHIAWHKDQLRKDRVETRQLMQPEAISRSRAKKIYSP